MTATLTEINVLILIKNCAVVKPFLRSFSDANGKQLDGYIIPTLVDEKPDVVLLYKVWNFVVLNNFLFENYSKADYSDIWGLRKK